MKLPSGDLLTSIYFQEIDTRERVFNRLQLNFAIYASAIAIMAYMARTIDYSSACHAITLFYVGLFFSLIFISLSIYYSILALTGFKYLCLPNSKELINYENKVYIAAKDQDEYNKKYATNLPSIDPEKIVREFISKSLAKCIDHNIFLNEYRRKLTRRAILHIIISGGALLFSSVIFIAYDLDVSSAR